MGIFILHYDLLSYQILTLYNEFIFQIYSKCREGSAMKPKLTIFALLICFIVVTGCAAVIVGVGAGAGVYTYMKGELKRSYPETFDKTLTICMDTLKSLKMTAMERETDGITTKIKAMQANGTPVTVKLQMIASKITEVSVRSGFVGVWDKKVSELIHASIAQRLQ